MFSQMAGLYATGLVISGVVFVAAVAAEGRAAHLIRLVLLHGRRGAREVMYSETPRQANDLLVVSQLGLSEVRYAELNARLDARIDARLDAEDPADARTDAA